MDKEKIRRIQNKITNKEAAAQRKKKIKKQLLYTRISNENSKIEKSKLNIERYKNKIRMIDGKSPDKSEETEHKRKNNVYNRLLSIAGHDFNENDSFFSYKYKKITSTSLWNISNKAVSVSKKYFLISRILKYTAITAAFIETSATLIITASVLIVALPIVLILLMLFNFFCYFDYRKKNARMKEQLKNKKVYIFIMASNKSDFSKDTFFEKNVYDIVKEDDSVAFIVTNARRNLHFISLDEQRKDKVWLCREGYYFSLQNNVLRKHKEVYIIW